MNIVKPTRWHCAKGNLFALGAAGLFLVCWRLSLDPGAEILSIGVGAFAGLIGAKLGFRALAAFYDDFRARRSAIVAAQPATEKYDGRLATEQEMADVGMYEPRGRLLGTDMQGRLLFSPYRLKPTFEFVLCPQGGGKTTTRVVASAAISPLLQSHRWN